MESRLSILIVDDDAVERMSLIRALTTTNCEYEITEVECVEDAQHQLESNAFDVLLLDYRLPGPDGIEFLFRIKNAPKIHKTAIVMVSNYSDDELIVNAINAGAHDYLLKEDVSPSQLKRSILQARKRYELEAELFHSYQKVKNMAERDALTGLYNRYHFDESLIQKVKAAERAGNELIAVMMMDLDKFKHINDTYGHHLGDSLLVEVAKRLNSIMRSNEMLARIGGDEFAIVCEHLRTIQEAKLVGNRILKALKKPFEINGVEIHFGCSIGVSVFPVNGNTASELMKCADIAMYRAKQDLDDKVCVYKDNMRQDVLFRYQVESELRAAIIQRDFVLNYQPIIKNGVLEGIETLIRWPQGTATQRPDQFIPIAEECGLISALGEWVVIQAFTEIKPLLVNQKGEFYLSLNVSPNQLKSEKFTNMLIENLDRFQIPAHNVVIEITETSLFNEDDVSLSTIEKLADIGVQIALDDFGTGYSSLSHLLSFPINIVKIDKSIVQNLKFDGSKTNAMLKGLSLMLDKLGIKAIAEGIETLDQAEFCNMLGINSHQGYLYSKPINLAKLNTKILNQKM